MPSDPELIPDKDYLKVVNPPPALFWFRDIRLFNRLDAEAAQEIRRIPLSRGLNIVWAKPSDPDESDPEARGRGHDVGKTTFCRLIRYLLGEKHYGTESTRRALSTSDKLDRPWVVGELELSGETWTIGRPLYSGGHPFAVRGKGLDEAIAMPAAERSKHEEFITHLQQEALKDFPVRSFDAQELRPLRWLHLLQWLARDQEAHLSSPFRWRDTTSHSESPDLSAQDTRFLVRCVLGVTDTIERRIIGEREQLEKTKEQLIGDIRFHERRVAEAIELARTGLPQGDQLPDIAESLFVDQVSRHAEHLVEARRAIIESQLGEIDITTVERELEQAIGRTAVAREQRDAEQKLLSDAQDRWERLTASDQAPALDELESILAALKPDRQHCEVPTNIALFKCPILREHRRTQEQPGPVPTGIEEQTAQLRNEVAQALTASRARLAALDQRLTSAVTTESAARKVRDQQLAEQRELQASLSGLSPEILTWRFRAEDAKRSHDALEEIRKQIDTIEDKASKLKSAQDAAQKAAKVMQKQIGKLFVSLCQDLKGVNVDAELKFTRDEINARIGSGGGAYNALSTLLFDYSAVLARMHRLGHHPGFLIHDSPRESDMEPSLYRPLFRLLKCFSDSAPDSFQYIVTTTEEPPPELSKGHVVTTLDGSTKEGFLFKTRF
ncbi:hypothetical protein HZ994_02405 [Akkermansiaceae bacterium]|nr:hypothetical protein HZ994_02405 [Akkermansiaceae bacterium]